MLEYNRAAAKAAAEPWELIEQIYTASRTTRYPSGQEWSPIQVAVNIEPASEAVDETRGHAVLKVQLFVQLCACNGFQGAIKAGALVCYLLNMLTGVIVVAMCPLRQEWPIHAAVNIEASLEAVDETRGHAVLKIVSSVSDRMSATQN